MNVRRPMSLSGEGPVSENVYDSIKELILEQRLHPGARINISEMARAVNVSATPVREALARLEADGLVTKQHQRGYSVTALLDTAAFDQLYEIRLLLEPAAAALAAMRAREDHMNAMQMTIEGMGRATTGNSFRMVNRYSSQDGTFHAIIADASGNSYVRDAIIRLHIHQQLTRLYFHHGILDADEAIPEHEHILAAIRQRDSDEASRRLRGHIERSRLRLAEILEAVEAYSAVEIS
jgi:DNA-binding GntR family transcriptional regulator